jgi:hypothetical protein
MKDAAKVRKIIDIRKKKKRKKKKRPPSGHAGERIAIWRQK